MLMTFRTALLGLLVLGFASTALAQEAEVGGGDKPISVGLLLGYGISFEDGGNLWGLGFGLRGGYNIDAIFLGARFVYYLGETEEIPALGIEISANIMELGIEGGYDIAVGPVIIRPGLGLGLAIASISADAPAITGTGDAADDSFTNPYIALGSSVLYDIDEQFFVGGDMRLQFVLGDEEEGGSATALILLANGGMRF